MRTFRNIWLILTFLLSSSVAFAFAKDDDLIRKFEEKKVKLIVFRHNESLNNMRDIVVSNRSPGYALTAKGLTDLRDDAKHFLEEGIQVVYTSPLYRSLQATQVIGDVLKMNPDKLVLDSRLRIQNFGSYEGKTYEDYKKLFCCFEDMLVGAAPSGEPGENVFQRTRQFLWKLASGSDTSILVVTHAFNVCHINMCLTGDFGDLPLAGEYKVYDFSK